MVGTCFFDLSKASGTVAGAPLAFHCQAPAGLLVSSHSLLNRLSKKWLLHLVGVCDQVTSGPPVMASAPNPVPYLLFQPRPILPCRRGLEHQAKLPAAMIESQGSRSTQLLRFGDPPRRQNRAVT